MEGRWHGDQAWKEGFEALIAPSLIPELLYCFFFFPGCGVFFPPWLTCRRICWACTGSRASTDAMVANVVFTRS